MCFRFANQGDFCGLWVAPAVVGAVDRRVLSRAPPRAGTPCSFVAPFRRAVAAADLRRRERVEPKDGDTGGLVSVGVGDDVLGAPSLSPSLWSLDEEVDKNPNADAGGQLVDRVAVVVSRFRLLSRSVEEEEVRVVAMGSRVCRSRGVLPLARSGGGDGGAGDCDDASVPDRGPNKASRSTSA